jgi:sec-independent protein translocase protein TatB
MFEISVSELMVLAVVGLVVVGPERLPKVARATGLFLGRLRRYADDVKTDIEREMRLDTLRKARTEFEDSIRHIGDDLDTEFRQVEQTLDENMRSFRTAFQAKPDEAFVEAKCGDGTEPPPALKNGLGETERNEPSRDTIEYDAP